MPPKATWKGQLAIGMLQLPVKLYSAKGKGKTSLQRVCNDCGQSIQNIYRCGNPECMKEHPFNTWRLHFEGVKLTTDEVKAIKTPSNATIQLNWFIPQSDLNPIWLDGSNYYVGVSEEKNKTNPLAHKGLALIYHVLKTNDIVGIGYFGMRGSEYLVALQSNGEGLILSKIVYEAVVREHPYRITGDVSEQEKQLLGQIITQADAFNYPEHRDQYEENLRTLINRKLEGEEIEVIPEMTQTAQETSLEDLLKASLGVS